MVFCGPHLPLAFQFVCGPEWKVRTTKNHENRHLCRQESLPRAILTALRVSQSCGRPTYAALELMPRGLILGAELLMGRPFRIRRHRIRFSVGRALTPNRRARRRRARRLPPGMYSGRSISAGAQNALWLTRAFATFMRVPIIIGKLASVWTPGERQGNQLFDVRREHPSGDAKGRRPRITSSSATSGP